MTDTLSSAFRPYAPGSQPPLDAPAYGSTQKRHPTQPLARLPGGQTPTETLTPRFSPARYPAVVEMARAGNHEAMGERIIVGGTLRDEDGRPLPGMMIELWQANAAGRYNHERDRHDAPLDPSFTGTGRVFTDAQGRYRFTTIKPGAYPWRNHHNAWRPNHIHYSLFGNGFAQRLITQMYFPGDPLLALDPVFNSVPDKAARDRLVSVFDLELTQPEWALGYRFDITLRGRRGTPFEGQHGLPEDVL
jgi:protocatechuate 3,4-dioxygenase, beta subunit